MNKFIAVLLSSAFLLSPGIISGSFSDAMAQENADSTDKVLVTFQKLFSANTRNREMFADTFLKAVPYEQIEQIFSTYLKDTGKFISYEKIKDTGKLRLNFEEAFVESMISLDSQNKITGLWFGAIEYRAIDLDKTLNDFKNLAGTTSVSIRKNGKFVKGFNQNQPLPSGSTFKLYILKLLKERIETGQDSWDKVIKLDENSFSLPSGMIQSWPDNSPVTLHTLASMMISISDNTATDALINYLGRENLETIMFERNRPLLTTLEMFKLKGAIGKEAAEAYTKKSTAEKRAYLETLKEVDKSKINFPETPFMNDKIEWFFTTEELSQVIESLGQEPILSINDGLATQDGWEYVGFKGGSEPGVLNMTYLLKKNGSKDIYSISATVNNPEKEVESATVYSLVSQIISAVYRDKI